MKKIWEKPNLIILVRSRPEEAVLEGCKWIAPTGADSVNNACGDVNCGWCSLPSTS